MLYIGIDLGTSACKLLLVNDSGQVLNEVVRGYPLSLPRPGWSEQAPQDWWNACLEGIPALLHGYDAHQICGLGVGGQMHGLVVLDDQDRILRPAILWNDSRTAEEVSYLNHDVGEKTLTGRTANIAFAGFTAPKLLWMRKHEPTLFQRIAKIMLPKDYIVYRLTGIHGTDYSDASGTLLLDVKNRRWSPEMIKLCGLRDEQLPRLFESYEPVGRLLPSVARLLGLDESVLVCAGAGDNAAAAVGTGAVGKGQCNISIGTSGTIFVSSNRFESNPNTALHTFAHADGGWHLLGCMLCAASCNKWFCEDILGSGDYGSEQSAILPERLGTNHVFFLPYLMGERSPINDTDARAMFVGMSMDTTRADLMQAVLEGVAFAIRDSFEAAKSLGLIERATICGGGSKSPLWRKILANVLGIPLDIVKTEQGPGYGAAMLAMTACGVYSSVQEAVEHLVQVVDTIEPDSLLSSHYAQRYSQFREIYPICKPLFQKLKF